MNDSIVILEQSIYVQILYLPTDAQYSCFKRILKFALKQLLHVSVQSPSSGSLLFELAKVAFSSVVRQIPGYTSQRRGTARTLP